jgi:hypothetical protein
LTPSHRRAGPASPPSTPPPCARSPFLGGGSSAFLGIPVGPGADEAVLEELGTDSCVRTAEALLQMRVDRLRA